MKKSKGKQTHSRYSLLNSFNTKWKPLSEDSQSIFSSKVNSITKNLRDEGINWLKILCYTGNNSVCRNVNKKKVVGIIASNEILSTDIGQHIPVICRLKNIPCVILSSDNELRFWSMLPVTSCIGLRKDINHDGLLDINCNRSVLEFESARSEIEKLIKKFQSLIEIPYIIPGESPSKLDSNLHLPTPNVEIQNVSPKIIYSKGSKRSEKRILRRERREKARKKFI
ncbi:hypothetical protein cand_030100 [Cryptosporidium andersoni]|uniref:Ribosomal protein eL8/eL30/eS12/Gadd45 domain-containing protein n=1 Tax=Cryptosporidium andersoni TaxID=117008 RepID=A0A1J4MS89_9CRYT|nr:hypothetical protein cand_030100 [Cryptosporidium andersoni]